jgi:hypothetical protein
VVIFSDGRKTALAAAAALRGVNNAVAPGEPLPEPAYTRAEGGVVSVIPCAYEDPEQQIDQDPAAANRVARALERELQAGAGRNDNLAVREVSCFRSPVPTRVGALSDAYQCQIGWRDGSFVTWCVLSGETDVLRETLPSDCETAAAGSESFIPAVDPGSDAAMRWGAHAAAACLPWRDKQTEAIAELDQDLLSQDLSYIWYVLRPTEAGLVRDLRVIPGRTGAARRAVAVYELRLALIDQGLREWQQGEKKRALEHWDRAEATKVALARAFDRVHAEACEPA